MSYSRGSLAALRARHSINPRIGNEPRGRRQLKATDMTIAKQAASRQSRFSEAWLRFHEKRIAAGLAAGGFLFDYLTPLGVAAGLIYASFIILAVWAAKPEAAFTYAKIATVLTVTGYFLFQRIGIDESVVLMNRTLTLFAIWIIASVVHELKTNQLFLEQKQKELTAIQDNTAEGMITIDCKGIIQSYNRACEKIFGYSASEAVGRNVKFLMPEPYRSRHDGYLAAHLRTGQNRNIGTRREFQGQHKDGGTFPLELSVSEVRVGGHHLFSGIVRDISDRKHAEAEREEIMSELARSNRDLDDFAYVASHDLRAPLRVIGNASQWLEEDLADGLDDDSRENLELLRARVSRMDRLLDDLLEYSRAGRQQDSRYQQTMPGGELMREVLMLVEKPEGFTISIAPGFDGIQLPNMPLKQIFTNLVSNAIKHNDRATGTVWVNVEDAGENYLFSVADDGPGIAPEYHDQVFKMFQTLKSRDEVEGSGIGLSIVKKHLERAGGTISVRSAPGEGCAFRFTWPKQQELQQKSG